MNPIVRNILACLAGIILGNLVNGGLIHISATIIPPPNGADTTTVEGLKATMHLFEPKHFLMPFLAHALGTLTGATLTAFLGATHKKKLAYGIGAFFLLGGTAAVFMLPSPIWFTILDLALAYIPMAYLATKIAVKN